MNLQALFLQTILTVAPPGYTKFSIVPVSCEGESCSGYQWSDFYNSYVRKESQEEGKQRYIVISDTVIRIAQNKLCLDDNLDKIPQCKTNTLFKNWKFVDLVSVVGSSMIAESGLREDVENGRGRAKKPSKDGGQGRGPGGEVCLLQIHPLVLSKFKIDPDSFLGESGESLENCFGFGMDMFARSRAMCAYQAIKSPEIQHDWVFETFSAYGTGSTCASANNGKTGYRKSLYITISSDFAARIKKAKMREERKNREVAESPTLPLPPPFPVTKNN
jgi:hypothetical protein